MATVASSRQFGRSIHRLEAREKVTGQTEYVHHLRLPGMLYGKIFRSTVAHGRIKSIDTSKAEKLPGVKAVVTSKDIVDFPIDKGAVMLGIQDMRWMCRNVMARDKALFPGHPVAAVAATSE